MFCLFLLQMGDHDFPFVSYDFLLSSMVLPSPFGQDVFMCSNYLQEFQVMLVLPRSLNSTPLKNGAWKMIRLPIGFRSLFRGELFMFVLGTTQDLQQRSPSKWLINAGWVDPNYLHPPGMILLRRGWNFSTRWIFRRALLHHPPQHPMKLPWDASWGCFHHGIRMFLLQKVGRGFL